MGQFDSLGQLLTAVLALMPCDHAPRFIHGLAGNLDFVLKLESVTLAERGDLSRLHPV